MKKGLHPEGYRLVVFKDVSTNDAFITRSTVPSKDTIVWEDGKEYPLFKLEISNKSHPFFTGKMQFVDTAGRIEKFNQRYKDFKKPTVKVKEPEPENKAADKPVDDSAKVEEPATKQVEETATQPQASESQTKDTQEDKVKDTGNESSGDANESQSDSGESSENTSESQAPETKDTAEPTTEDQSAKEGTDGDSEDSKESNE